MYRTFSDTRPLRRCIQCGTEFLQKHMTTGKFCRPRCGYDYRQIQSRQLRKACAACGKRIQSEEGDSHVARRKFCSRACANGALVQNRVAKPPPPIDGARWLPLTRNRFALVDADLFEELMQRPWTYSHSAPFHGRRDGTPKRLHRFILGVRDPSINVDHRNGDTLDNRRQNLRIATHAENIRNTRKKGNAKTSLYKGVHFAAKQRGHKKWQAMIRVSGRGRWLGGFATQEEAARAYDTAARESFGEFACVNFPIHGERGAVP